MKPSRAFRGLVGNGSGNARRHSRNELVENLFRENTRFGLTLSLQPNINIMAFQGVKAEISVKRVS